LVDTTERERMSTMAQKRRNYTKEFIDEAVRLVKTSGKPMVRISRDLGINDKTLWNWVAAAKEAQGEVESKPLKQLTMTEREELRQLRRENALLREEREILKKAAAFFAKEST
jgi:transposase